MAVRLRLKRIGRTHRAIYRLGATDTRTPRDGVLIEELGLYDPQNKNPDMQLSVNEERVRHWLSVGAVPSDTVEQLLRRKGIKR